MPEWIRSTAARLNKSVANYLSAPRRKARLPITITLKLPRQTAGLIHASNAPKTAGWTFELSKNEISFVLPVIRLGEYYLAGSQQKLQLEVELPDRTMHLTATALRYEQIEVHNSVSQYLISTEIVEMRDGDREYLERFVKLGDKAGEEEGAAIEGLQPERAKAGLIGQFFSFF